MLENGALLSIIYSQTGVDRLYSRDTTITSYMCSLFIESFSHIRCRTIWIRSYQWPGHYSSDLILE